MLETNKNSDRIYHYSVICTVGDIICRKYIEDLTVYLSILLKEFTIMFFLINFYVLKKPLLVFLVQMEENFILHNFNTICR